MTRAPASASRQVHIGAATACSSATTSRPSSGRVILPWPFSSHGRACPGHPRLCFGTKRKRWMPATSAGMTVSGARSLSLVRPWQIEHVLGEVGENEVGRDRRHLVEPRLAEFALDIEFLGEAEAA